jgi:hypothetical protein
MKKISSSKNSVDTKCFAGRQLLPGSEEQQYQKLRQHKVIMQKYIYSFSFIADRRAAFDPPVNLSADLGDQKAVPTHANETRHLQNTEHRFLRNCCQPQGLPMCKQHAEDATRFGRAGEELHKCILEPAQISNQPWRSFNEAGMCRFGPIQVDTDKRPSDEEQRQGDEKLRCDDNYAKECGIHDLCFAWNCR